MQQSVEPFLQLCQPLAAPGGDANHRNAQALFQPGQVDGDMPLFRLVQEVDTEQGFGTGLQHLHDQQQSTFQTGGITDHYRRIRFGKTEKVPCHSLFGTPGTERIGAGQIGKQNGLAAADSCADGAGYGFSCPVRALNTVDFPTLGIPARATTGCSRWDSSGGSSADDVRIARFVLSIAWFFAILCGKERKKTACEKAVFFKCVRMVCEVFKAYLAYLAYKMKECH